MDSPFLHRSILHVDMDCFYVSVERLHDPSLVGLPVAVGGTAEGRGVVASASYEARAFGVRSAMPASQALRLCPKLILIRGRYGDYARYSALIADVFSQFTPLVQMVSQDEAYLDLTGTERINGPLIRAAQSLRDAVLESTGLPCSLGLASNRTVAKIASDLCKPRGLFYVPAGSEASFLRPLPISKLPGMGPRSVEKAKELGLRTIGDLATAEKSLIDRHFGSHGEVLRQRSAGIDESLVETREEVKSVGNEETFDKDSREEDFLHAILSFLSEKVGFRLRSKKLAGKTVTLKYRYENFETHTAAQTLPVATDDDAEIYNAARRLLNMRWDRSRSLRLLGVSVGNLSLNGEQLDLIEQPEQEKRRRLNSALDAIKRRHGTDRIHRATGRLGDEEESETP